MFKAALMKSFIITGSSITVNGLNGEQVRNPVSGEMNKLRGTQNERELYMTVVTPSPVPPANLNGWLNDGFQPLETPAPTGWKGDAFVPVPPPAPLSWTDDGWDDDKYPSNVVNSGSKSYKIGFNTSGSKSTKSDILDVSNTYIKTVSGSKSVKYDSITYVGSKSVNGGSVTGIAGKSFKGDSVTGIAGKSVKGDSVTGSASKSVKGDSTTITGGKSKTNSVKITGGKSTGSSVAGIGSKSSKDENIVIGGGNISPIKPIPVSSSWNDDGWTAPVTIKQNRGKWSDDGWMTPEIVTEAPIDSWNGDSHSIITPSPTSWKGDGYPSPSPTSCDERMIWHPNNGFTLCTNDSIYPPGFEYVYTSLEECCMAVFLTPSCKYIDVCSTPEPTHKPTPEPTPEYVVPPPTPSPTICEERKWYVCTTDLGMICTNGYHTTVTSGYMTYESLVECCVQEFGSVTCSYEDVCSTSPPTPLPTRFPTSLPTPLPTPSPTPYPTLKPIATIITPPPSPSPTICEERNWYACETNSGSTICSNGYHTTDISGDFTYESLTECCMEVFGSVTCIFEDICSTFPPTSPPTNPPSSPPTYPPTPLPTDYPTPVPKITTNPPTLYPITPVPTEATPVPTPPPTPVPTEGETPVPTPPPTPVPTELETPVPTPASSFGSTPTVSKETTGPPTMTVGRERSAYRKEVSTECEEIRAGHPVVCVNVCTHITSIFDGHRLVDETAKTTQSECKN